MCIYIIFCIAACRFTVYKFCVDECILPVRSPVLHIRTSLESIIYVVSQYRKRGKIRWANLLQIPPNVVFHGKTFAVQHLNNAITQSLYKDSQKNFRSALETVKNAKV